MNKNLEKNEYFVSADLSICAFLCCLGYQIEKITKEGQKVYFYRPKDDKTDELIRKFWAHQVKIDALTYFGFLKEIKARIFNNN